jgi:hypothetical protein
MHFKDKLSYSSSLFPFRIKEHVRGAAQTPSAQMVEELADSFSEQLPGRIADKGKSVMGILVEEKDLVSYRRDWEYSWGSKFGLFQDYSNLLNHLVLVFLIFFLLHASVRSVPLLILQKKIDQFSCS